MEDEQKILNLLSKITPEDKKRIRNTSFPNVCMWLEGDSTYVTFTSCIEDYSPKIRKVIKNNGVFLKTCDPILEKIFE